MNHKELFDFMTKDLLDITPGLLESCVACDDLHNGGSVQSGKVEGAEVELMVWSICETCGQEMHGQAFVCHARLIRTGMDHKDGSLAEKEKHSGSGIIHLEVCPDCYIIIKQEKEVV